MTQELLLARIQSKEITLAVVGLGYVGLPLAVEFAKGGIRVVGIEVDPNKVKAIQAGDSYIPDVPTAEVSDLVQRGLLRATTDFSILRDCDAVSICVPTPLNKTRDPDMSYIIAAANQITQYCHADFIIVLESTTYPGTTDEILRPRLEAAGYQVGLDVFLAFSPERIDPGNPHFQVRNTPKVVGGATPACVAVATALYQVAIDHVVPVSSLRAAEMVKLLENTFRAVNIGLVNEMVFMCEKLEVDVWEVIEAAATKPYGFMKFTPGPGIGGHCLSGGEYVYLKDGTGVHCLPLQTLWERLEAQSLPELINQPELRAYAPCDWHVLSYDPDRVVTVWRPVQYMARRAYHGPMVTVKTSDGRRLHVTDEHPMMVFENESLRQRPAVALQIGDELVVPTGPLPARSPDPLDVMARLPGAWIDGIRVKPVTARYSDHQPLLQPYFLALGLSPRDVYRQNVLPLTAYVALEALGCMPIPRAEVRLVTGRGPSCGSFPAVVEIDEGFARLLGYYLSEGCITATAGTRTVRFTFHRQELETIADLTQILGRLGLNWSMYYPPDTQAATVKVSSYLLAFLLDDLLGCGTDCYTMRIPARLLEAPDRLRWALLAGLLRGDGDVDYQQREREYTKRGRRYRHRLNACSVGYFSSSPILFQQVAGLLQGFGLVPTFRPNRPQLRLYGAVAAERLTPLFLDAKRARLESYRVNRSKPMPTKQARSQPGFATVRVRAVEAAPAEPAVYSLEVGETHTFITSYGLLVHNCIPIDPLYLSWKLKALNYTARFIDLADSINSRMPEYVATRVADALNDDGRPLNGAHILVIGVAYKPNSDDVRESPALDVISELVVRKAAVTYHDPFVAQVTLGDRTWQSVPLSPETLAGSDCVVITTDHAGLDWELVRRHARVIVDTRNAVRGPAPAGSARVVKL